jgi:transposase-like protein
VFRLIDRGSNDRYIVSARSADESTIRLLLAEHNQKLLTVYTDGFHAYDPLEDDEAFSRKYVVHADGEYADGEVLVTGYKNHASHQRRWTFAQRGVSKDRLTPYLRAFQLRCELYRKPGYEILKHSLDAALLNQQRPSQRRLWKKYGQS